MAAELSYPHIRKEPGTPARVESHPRTRVSMIVRDYLGYGLSPDQIVRMYPYLSLAETYAAMAYYFDHREEIEQEIEEEDRQLQHQAPSSPVVENLRVLKADASKCP